jgi:hypothetical protein
VKKTFFIILLAACAYAQPPKVDVGKGHVVCLREKWLRDTFEFYKSRDGASMNSYRAMKRCEPIEEGGRAYLLAREADAAQILIGGRKLWIVIDGVRF